MAYTTLCFTEVFFKLCLMYLQNKIQLHYRFREEQRKQAKRRVSHIKKDEDNGEKLSTEEEVPPSVAVLFSGHEFLGLKYIFQNY